MAGNVQVQNLPPIMPNNKEAVQQLEGDRRDDEEIHGRDSCAMIANKGQPAPGKFWISGSSLHPAGDASLRYIETQHEQFAVDAGSTPGWVLPHHPEDQIPNSLRQPFSTNLVFHLRDQAPIESKSGTMPAVYLAKILSNRKINRLEQFPQARF
jgi:hypothetical protein